MPDQRPLPQPLYLYPVLQMNEPRYFLNGTDDPCAQDPTSCAAKLQVWSRCRRAVAFCASWVLDSQHLLAARPSRLRPLIDPPCRAPQLPICCPKTPSLSHSLQNWIAEMSAFLKQEDPNHLVTVRQQGGLR